MKVDINEFKMDKTKPDIDEGFVPEIVESIGYGIKTAIDPNTNNKGLVPVEMELINKQGNVVNNPECYAKAIKFKNDDKHVFYLRMDSSGNLSDPWDMYSFGGHNSNFIRHTGRDEWEFKRVPEKIFMNYLNYLVSQNKVIFRDCERRLKDNER